MGRRSMGLGSSRQGCVGAVSATAQGLRPSPLGQLPRLGPHLYLEMLGWSIRTCFSVYSRPERRSGSCQNRRRAATSAPPP